MNDLKRIVRKDEEPDLYGLLEEATLGDHSIIEIKGVTWLVESYTSEPNAEIILVRLNSR